MRQAPDLQLLLPTTFPAACGRTVGAITQIARTCRVTLTLLHVEAPGAPSLPARRALETFRLDVDDLQIRERALAVSDDPAAVVAAMCRGNRFDLIMAPASDRTGLHQLFTRSFRAKVLARCRVPLWTAGSCLQSADFGHPIRTVACLIDFDEAPASFIPLVVAFAQRMGAHVHFLTVVPPVDDGTLARMLTSDAPLRAEDAVDEIARMAAGCDNPTITAETGPRGRTLRRMLAHSGADLLFVGARHAATPWSLRFSRDLDRLPCPVVCIDAAAGGFAGWSFQELPQPVRRPRVIEALA